MELTKAYTPNEIEAKWYPIWEESGYFKSTMKSGAPSYSIFMPPPNVTGTLHMGHGFQHALMDILTRYHRMKGFNTLWQPGTDHAGIATQIVVERQLDMCNISRHDLGRDQFVERIWQWKQNSGDTITRQMRRLGDSCDWSKECFTMDEELSHAVTEVFVRLHEKGYIYRGKRLVNWDVKLQTAVSDLEVESHEENGHLWLIRYLVKDSDGVNSISGISGSDWSGGESVVVATTRPETMLGDVAVAVNPKDERYQHLVGKMLILPLQNREIPIIADDYVDMEFGTGCVKITPGHDFNDYEIGRRHNLPVINILTLDGHINQEAPQQYQGLERFAARKQIIADLESAGLLVEIKPHKLMVPRGDRTNTVIEPMLTNQWYVAMDKLAQTGLELVKDGAVKFVPDNWTVIYNQWLENIQDWCISRQLWWGHRIPAYYDKSGKYYVARTLADAISQAGTDNLTQDDDVLDTWFSSGLWCFSTLGWPGKTPELEMFLPSRVLVTGFDIIFFWVARMIMLTHEFTGKVPFREVCITGLIQDAHGNKMSKSKGNIIDPLDLIDGISLDELIKKRTQNLMNPKQAETIATQTAKDYPNGFQAFGADALRFTFAALATHGREIRFDVKRIEGSRNFCNKLWNAGKFVLMNVQQHASLIENNATNVQNAANLWILNELVRLIGDLEFAYATYRFDVLAQKLYEFIWNEFCDWYLELAKVNLTSDDVNIRTNTINVLLIVFECSLRLLHPIMPFITEELWQIIASINNKKTAESIMLARYPTIDEIKAEIEAGSDSGSVADGDVTDENRSYYDIKLLKEIITCIRNLRGEMNLNPGLKVPLLIEVGFSDASYLSDASDMRNKLDDFVPYIQSLAKISEVVFVDDGVDVNGVINSAGSAPVAVVAGVRFMLQVEIDVAQEKIRLKKEIDKNIKESEKINLKLKNSGFLEKAPKDLIERDTARIKELDNIVNHLSVQLSKLT